MKIKDQTSREITITSTSRIVCLVPSITELLVDLGLKNQLVGVTKFCVHPKGLKEEKSVIGGTKQLHIDKIQSLSPDIIIANKEENNKDDILLLEKEFPVYVSDIKSIDDLFCMIDDFGKIFEKQKEANSIISSIKIARKNNPKNKLKTALYLIWKSPYMAAGNDTFINTMMEEFGYKNIIHQNRYPELTIEDIKNLNPKYILLSSEPYPFKEKHVDEMKKLIPNSIVKIVDGEIFSWYGTRVLNAL